MTLIEYAFPIETLFLTSKPINYFIFYFFWGGLGQCSNVSLKKNVSTCPDKTSCILLTYLGRLSCLVDGKHS